MKERWNPIQSGVSRKDIRVSGINIFVRGKILGSYIQCVDGTFCCR